MNESVVAGFVWQVVPLVIAAYAGRNGVGALADAASRSPREVQLAPSLNLRMPASRMYWTIACGGLLSYMVGAAVAVTNAITRLTAGTWIIPATAVVIAWLLVIIGSLGLHDVGSVSIVRDKGLVSTIHAARRRCGR